LSVPTEAAVNQYLLSLGSNIAPEQNIIQAGLLLSRKLNLLSASSIWKTKAVGSDGPDFLNAVILVESSLAPTELKTNILSKIENQLGRIRTDDKNSPRTIDIDIVMANRKVIDQEIWSQAHISVPAAEIYPDITQPGTGITLRDQAKILEQRARVFPVKKLDLKFLINLE